MTVHISEEKFYAIFWRDKEGLYLEKYICSKCDNISFKKKKVVLFELADRDIQDAIRKNFRKKYQGIITPLETEDDWEIFIKNPTLLNQLGKKF